MSEQEEETPEPVPTDANFVVAGSEIQYSYPVGCLPASLESGPLIQIIFIAEIDGKVLVCLPTAAWHRTKDRRILKSTLAKPSVVDVLCVSEDVREEPLQDMMRVWIGLLSQDAVSHVHWDEEPGTGECLFQLEGASGFLPYAKSLADAASEHFSFLSAESTVPQPAAPEGASGSADLGSRMNRVEEMMESLTTSFQTFMSQQPQRQPNVTASSAPPRVRVDPSPKDLTSRKPALRRPQDVEQNPFPDLDAGMVQAALASGVDRRSLEQMQALISRNVKKTSKLPDPFVGQLANPLSDSEEEGQEAAASGLAPSSQDPVAAALSKLTEIAGVLAEDRKKRSSSSKLEAALDSAHGGSSEASVGSGKRSAAAWRALRATLRDSPTDVSNLLERLMMEDLRNVTLTPGQPVPGLSSRAWVEHRSRIGAYKTSAHAAWCISGALDCLIQGDVPGCRARLNLGLLQLDQTAIDRGNWVLSSDLSLEPPPPFSSLAQHVLPDPSRGDLPFSRLLDPRWAEISVAHLADTDSYLTKRKTLGRASADQSAENPDASSKRKAKQKAKPKPGEQAEA